MISAVAVTFFFLVILIGYRKKSAIKNLRKIIFQSNAEIKRKEELKNLAQKISVFFDELFKITENPSKKTKNFLL